MKNAKTLSFLITALLVGNITYAMTPDEAEYFNSRLNLINAKAAYADGYTGKGVAVCVADSDVVTTPQELQGKVLLRKDYKNVFLKNKGAPHPHSTGVSGIIAAKKDGRGIHGTAYNSQLINISGANEWLMENIRDNSNIKIMNRSYVGIAYPLDEETQEEDPVLSKNWQKTMDQFDSDDIKALRNSEEETLTHLKELAKKDVAMVFAAGNEGRLSTYVIGGGIAGWLPDAYKRSVSVIACNDIKSPAFFSNLAKGLAENSVSAPGTNLPVLQPDGTYIENSGTSFAAPYVSGTLALIQEAYPFLTSKQMVDVLLTTADNKFATPDYFMQFYSPSLDNTGNISGLNLIYIDKPVPSPEKQLSDLRKYIDDYGWCLQKETLLQLFKTNGKSYSLTRQEVYGRGIADAGKAVKGPSVLEENRADAIQDVLGSRYALYHYNTGDSQNNYKQRDFSTFKNDIAERPGKEGLHSGLVKRGAVTLELAGLNTYKGPTVCKEGRLVSSNSTNSVMIANGGDLEIAGRAKDILFDENSHFRITDDAKQGKPSRILGNIQYMPASIITVPFIKEQYLPDTPEENTIHPAAISKEDNNKEESRYKIEKSKETALIDELFGNKDFQKEIAKQKELVRIFNEDNNNVLKPGEIKLLRANTNKPNNDEEHIKRLKKNSVILCAPGSIINGAIIDTPKNPIDLQLSGSSIWLVGQNEQGKDSEINGAVTIDNSNMTTFVKLENDLRFQTLTLHNAHLNNACFSLKLDLENHKTDKLAVNEKGAGSMLVFFSIPSTRIAALPEAVPEPIKFAETKGSLSVEPFVTLISDNEFYEPVIAGKQKGVATEWYLNGFKRLDQLQAQTIIEKYVSKKA